MLDFEMLLLMLMAGGQLFEPELPVEKGAWCGYFLHKNTDKPKV